MENTFWTALATSSLAAIVTSIGIYTIRRYVEWGKRNSTYFMCFAAGVLISASFLHIIPKSISMNPNAPFYLLSGFFGLHFFNRFITAFVCQKDPQKEQYGIGVMPMLGALLSLSAGALVYVGATHLLPKAEQEHKRYSFVALGGGILVTIIIVLSKA